MKPSVHFSLPAVGVRLLRATAFLTALGASSSLVLAQENPNRGDSERRRTGGQDESGGRRTFSPQDIQARMLSNLRERLGVTSDDEWTIVSERIAKVMELRRTSGAGGSGLAAVAAFRGGAGAAAQGGADAGRAGFRGARPGGSPEMEALQAAVTDKLPEAEIKARLTKLRETRKANEKKLEQAQEELRAVLTVRQEAMAVLFGLLP